MQVRGVVKGLIIVVGIAVAGIGYAFELADVFLYTGYAVVRLAALAVALALAVMGFVGGRGERLAGTCGIAVGLTLMAAAYRLESSLITPRKAFWAEARRVRPGMTVTDVAGRFQGCRSFSVKPGHVSYGFASDERTQDVVIVTFDPGTLKVIDAQLSLD